MGFPFLPLLLFFPLAHYSGFPLSFLHQLLLVPFRIGFRVSVLQTQFKLKYLTTDIKFSACHVTLRLRNHEEQKKSSVFQIIEEKELQLQIIWYLLLNQLCEMMSCLFSEAQSH
jgi:hypothetical protein